MKWDDTHKAFSTQQTFPVSAACCMHRAWKGEKLGTASEWVWGAGGGFQELECSTPSPGTGYMWMCSHYGKLIRLYIWDLLSVWTWIKRLHTTTGCLIIKNCWAFSPITQLLTFPEMVGIFRCLVWAGASQWAASRGKEPASFSPGGKQEQQESPPGEPEPTQGKEWGLPETSQKPWAKLATSLKWGLRQTLTRP